MAESQPAQKVRPTKTTDERLLIEGAQLDRARFADLYEHYFEVVYAYVARRVKDRATTEDLTSEVFRKALASLPRYRWTGAPFAAWLFRIASNLIADRAKREARLAASSADTDLISHDSGKDTQASLENVERRAQLIRLVEKLPEDQRRVVALRFADEKSIREIAAELDRSEGAVKQLQFRALENLRKKISPQKAQRRANWKRDERS
jgi:RNA polymerase sigma-70 factor, ECF subfamily